MLSLIQMRAHLVQFNISWEDKPANFEKVLAMLEAALVEPGDLILLPEMFDTGFSMNPERTRDAGDVTLAFLCDLADAFDATVQGGRTVGDGTASNVMTIVYAAPDGKPTILGEYAKIHPFTLGKEHERFTPGDRIVIYEWRGSDGSLRVMPAICYDLRFPELFRLGLLEGAEVFSLGACWPVARQSHWRALLVARAIENQAVVLGVNRVGNDPNLMYTGGTIAIGPTGEILGELGDEERVLSVEIDPGAVRRWREKFPAWRDARLLGHLSNTQNDNPRTTK